MINHPASVLGWITASIGFLLLFFWVPTGLPSSGFGISGGAVFNLHKAEIAKAVLTTGFVLVIAGTISQGFDRLMENGKYQPAGDQASVAESSFPSQSEGSDLEAGSVVTVKDRQGKSRDLLISENGKVTINSFSGPKTFDSLDEAKAFVS